MNVIQWIISLCSMYILPLLVAGIVIPLILFFAVSRSGGVILFAIIMGLATTARMIMMPIQSAIGVPGGLRDMSFMGDLSFGDLISGNEPAVEIAVASVGMLSAVIGALYLSKRFTHLISQIENIPTSTARAAAIGLAEFKGVARPAPGALPEEIDWELFRMREEDIIEGRDIEIPKQYLLINGTEKVTVQRGRSIVSEPLPLMKWSAFYLEDATGRILVDPRRVMFGGPTLAPFVPGFAQTLDITKNWEATKRGARKFLKPGDLVYVIGTVQENTDIPLEARDSERLVVRPKIVNDPREQQSFKEIPFITGTLDDVFIVSDDREMSLTATLRKGRAYIYISALIIMVISAIYLGHYLRGFSL